MPWPGCWSARATYIPNFHIASEIAGIIDNRAMDDIQIMVSSDGLVQEQYMYN